MDKYKIISKALEYYDKNLEINRNNIFNKSDNYKIFEEDNKNKIIFYKNKKEIFKFNCEQIGMYDKNSNTWIWSWSDPYKLKSTDSISRRILNYGLNLDKNQILLKSTLITSRFKVYNETQINIKIALSSYLSKNPIVFSVDKYKLNEYYFLYD